MKTLERNAGPRHLTGTSLLKASVAVLALSLVSVGVAACKPADADPRNGAPLVRVATVHSASAAERAFTGVIAAKVQSNLGFRVRQDHRAPRRHRADRQGRTAADEA